MISDTSGTRQSLINWIAIYRFRLATFISYLFYLRPRRVCLPAITDKDCKAKSLICNVSSLHWTNTSCTICLWCAIKCICSFAVVAHREALGEGTSAIHGAQSTEICPSFGRQVGQCRDHAWRQSRIGSGSSGLNCWAGELRELSSLTLNDNIEYIELFNMHLRSFCPLQVFPSLFQLSLHFD